MDQYHDESKINIKDPSQYVQYLESLILIKKYFDIWKKYCFSAKHEEEEKLDYFNDNDDSDSDDESEWCRFVIIHNQLKIQ